MKKIDILGVTIYSNMKPISILNRLRNRLDGVIVIDNAIVIPKNSKRIYIKFFPKSPKGRITQVLEVESNYSWMKKEKQVNVIYDDS